MKTLEMAVPVGGEIHFHAPGLKRYETSEFVQRDPNAFVPISLTGPKCALGCEHCGGQLLRWMRPLGPGQSLFDLCRGLAQNGTRGVLISGGSDWRGHVPLAGVAKDLKRIKKDLGMRVAVHTGLVDEPTADLLRQAEIDAALLDVVGADETARRILHLGVGARAFERSLAFLEAAGVPTIPHVVMGLHYGRFLGEEQALEWIGAHCRQPGRPAARQANGALPRALPWADLARERPLARGGYPLARSRAHSQGPTWRGSAHLAGGLPPAHLPGGLPPPRAVVLVAFTPLEDTPMAGVPPPRVSEIVAFMEKAREALPAVPLWLGCARPAGEAREAMDRAAVDLGFAGVAYPSDGLVAYARACGRVPRFHEACCGILG